MNKLLAFLMVLSPALTEEQGKSVVSSQSLVFTHVTVIDATGAPAQADMTVVITALIAFLKTL